MSSRRDRSLRGSSSSRLFRHTVTGRRIVRASVDRGGPHDCLSAHARPALGRPDGGSDNSRNTDRHQPSRWLGGGICAARCDAGSRSWNRRVASSNRAVSVAPNHPVRLALLGVDQLGCVAGPPVLIATTRIYDHRTTRPEDSPTFRLPIEADASGPRGYGAFATSERDRALSRKLDGAVVTFAATVISRRA